MYFFNYFIYFYLINTTQQYIQRTSSIFEKIKESSNKCQLINNISSSLCQNIPYNKTIFPNPFIEMDQTNIKTQIEHFKPLIRTNCSPNILLFICSVFIPMCPEQIPQAITSCKSVCEEIYKDCIKIFNQFDFPWPSILNCSRFPSPPTICIKPEFSNNNILSEEKKSLLSIPKLPECPLDLIDLNPNNSTNKCAFRCEKTTMFKKDKKEQARLWFLFWSILNLLINFFTICSFWIDRQRFCFPEKSIGFLALCSFFINLPHLLRQLIGFEKIACTSLINSNIRYLIIEGFNQNIFCFFNFLFYYFCSLAANCWWLIFGFTLYLSASKKWVEEEIKKRSFLFHFFAWGFPTLLSIIALNNNLIDASELTGICSLGNFDQLSLFWFWILPRIIINLIGFFLFLIGFLSIYKERNKFKNKGTDISKLEKFILKMGIFILFYLMFIFLNILCDLHYLIIINEWQPNTINCKTRGGAFSGNCLRPEPPEPKLYIFGQTMGMAIGLSAGLFIFSPKTLSTMSLITNWKKAIFCCYWPLKINKSFTIKKQQQKPLLSSVSILQKNNKNIISSSSFTILNSQQKNENNYLQNKQNIPLSFLSNKSTTMNIKNNEIYEKHIEKRYKEKNSREEKSNITYL